jgi:hypothetical protein
MISLIWIRVGNSGGGFEPRLSGYELDPLDRLDYMELAFQAEFRRSSYVEIGWDLWGTLPQCPFCHFPRISSTRATTGKTDCADPEP